MRWLWVAIVCVPTIAAADDDLDVPGLDAADLRGDAMIWEDATLYFEPWESGASIRFSTIGRRESEVGRAIPVRIIDSTLRSFVEVEAPSHAGCTSRRLDVDPRLEGLRMFVHRADLAPVLIKPFAATYSDGTRIKLAVGLPVMPTATGDYWVPLREDKIRLPIPHASVGYVYRPGKIADPEIPKDKLARLDRNASIKLGDGGFTVRTNSWIGPMPDKKPDGTLFKLAARCLEMVVEAPSNTLRPIGAPRPSGGQPVYVPRATGWRIPAGTPITTQSGREVAVAAKDIQIQMPAPAPETVCFDLRMTMTREDQSWGTIPRTFKLCASGSAVEH